MMVFGVALLGTVIYVALRLTNPPTDPKSHG
jgi:hypothetical protein